MTSPLGYEQGICPELLYETQVNGQPPLGVARACGMAGVDGCGLRFLRQFNKELADLKNRPTQEPVVRDNYAPIFGGQQ